MQASIPGCLPLPRLSFIMGSWLVGYKKLTPLNERSSRWKEENNGGEKREGIKLNMWLKERNDRYR